jgi:cytoplasmic iron level regulating protein YaaA (DUF328/UPF0246 family)
VRANPTATRPDLDTRPTPSDVHGPFSTRAHDATILTPGVGPVRQDVAMLVLLPPSETKADGGVGAPLDVGGLAFPELTRVRERLLRKLVTVSGKPRAGLTALGLTPRQRDELLRNLEIDRSPTMPAIERYTGVLYDVLDVGSLRGTARTRAFDRLAIGSALFGVVRAGDHIPAYRLSAASRLPGVGTLASAWRPRLLPVLDTLAREQLVVDLRSGAYRALAPVDGAITVQVLSQHADGSRSVVSHANKSTKGTVARLLATTPQSCGHRDAVARVLRAGGLVVEAANDVTLDVVVPA